MMESASFRSPTNASGAVEMHNSDRNGQYRLVIWTGSKTTLHTHVARLGHCTSSTAADSVVATIKHPQGNTKNQIS